MSPNKPPRKRPGSESTLTASTETLQVGDAAAVSPKPFEQPQPPAVEPEPKAEPAAAEAPPPPAKSAPRPRQTPPAAASPDARAAFEASVMLARTHPRDWEPYSVRLPEEVWARLEERVEADQAAYGVASLAMSHYINAALDRVPRNAKEAADVAVERMAAQGLRPPATRSSGTRLHRDVLKRMELLPAQLRRVARPGLLGHLQAAALEAFLDELDAG